MNVMGESRPKIKKTSADVIIIIVYFLYILCSGALYNDYS